MFLISRSKDKPLLQQESELCIEPFKVAGAEQVLSDHKTRIRNTRWPERWTPMERGGHFAPTEEPVAVTPTLRRFSQT